jgi:ribonuclease J
VRERRKLSIVGVVAVSLVVSRKGALIGEPLAVLDGVPAENAQGDSMLDIVLDAIEGTLRSIPEKHRKNPDSLAESVRRSVRAAVNEAWGKKPICKVLVNVVDRG